MKKPGIRDVARQAGVSPAAVSRYLNRSGYVSEDSEARIRQAILDLDYTPNELARNLFNNRSGIIAVLVPDSAHPFFAAYVREIERELFQHDYRMLLCNTARAGDDEEKRLFDMLKQHIVDGLITGVHTTEYDDIYARMNEPIVSLDRRIGNVPLVASNHEAAGLLASQRLLDMGCKRIMIFSDDASVSTPAHRQTEFFMDYLRSRGAEVIHWASEGNDFTYNFYRSRAAAAFEAHPDADGVYGTDLYAIAYLQTALRTGKRVPEDVKVIAYDSTFITDLYTPRLTSVAQPIPQLAHAAVDLLLRRIAGEDLSGARVVLDVHLNVGETG